MKDDDSPTIDRTMQPERGPAQPLTPDMKRELRAAADKEAARKKAQKHQARLAAGDKIAYNVLEAAAAMGLSEWFIRDEIKKQRLAMCKIRGRILIPRYELERYLEEYMRRWREELARQAALLPKRTDPPKPDPNKNGMH